MTNDNAAADITLTQALVDIRRVNASVKQARLLCRTMGLPALEALFVAVMDVLYAHIACVENEDLNGR